MIALISSYLGAKRKGDKQYPYRQSVKGFSGASAVGFAATGLHFTGYSDLKMSFGISTVANGSQQTEGTSLSGCLLLYSFVKGLDARR